MVVQKREIPEDRRLYREVPDPPVSLASTVHLEQVLLHRPTSLSLQL